MVQFQPFSIWVHGTFVNEVVFKLLGVRVDANGMPLDIGSFETGEDGIVRRTPAGPWRTRIENWVIREGYLFPDSTPEAMAYEREIMDMLKRINRTIVGSELLRAMNRQSKIVISPYNSMDMMRQGVCNAAASNRKSFDGNIRVAFTPGGGCHDSDDPTYPMSSDQVLVHELFHSYLHTIDKAADFYKAMEESKTEDEFLAVQVPNMYRAETGRTVFDRVYGGGTGAVRQPTIVTRKELEEYFASSQEALDALNPDRAPLFKRYSGFPQLPLNPFREWHKYYLKLRSRNAKPYRMHYLPETELF